MIPSTEDVIAYLNRDIFLTQLAAKRFEKECSKDPLNCGGCKEMQSFADTITDYKRVVLRIKQNTGYKNLEGFKDERTVYELQK